MELREATCFVLARNPAHTRCLSGSSRVICVFLDQELIPYQWFINFILLFFNLFLLARCRSKKLCCFKLDPDEIWQDHSYVNVRRSTDSDFWYDVILSDGGHDIRLQLAAAACRSFCWLPASQPSICDICGFLCALHLLIHSTLVLVAFLFAVSCCLEINKIFVYVLLVYL